MRPLYCVLIMSLSLLIGLPAVSQAVTQDLRITWSASTPNAATGYRVMKETTPGVFVQVGPDLPATTLIYTDANQAFGQTFCYGVVGLGAINSVMSVKQCSTTAGVTSIPGSVVVTTVVIGGP